MKILFRVCMHPHTKWNKPILQKQVMLVFSHLWKRGGVKQNNQGHESKMGLLGRWKWEGKDRERRGKSNRGGEYH
jgi:hypothetical protein